MVFVISTGGAQIPKDRVEFVFVEEGSIVDVMQIPWNLWTVTLSYGAVRPKSQGASCLVLTQNFQGHPRSHAFMVCERTLAEHARYLSCGNLLAPRPSTPSPLSVGCGGKSAAVPRLPSGGGGTFSRTTQELTCTFFSAFARAGHHSGPRCSYPSWDG